jgi:hypothetical protein
MSELIPLNDDDAQSEDPEQQANRARDPRKKRARRGRSAEPGIADTDACLRALSQLPGLIVMGVVKPTQANSIRSTYHVILQHHQHSEDKHEQGKIADDDVLQMLRQSPSLISMLEPLLTEAQIELLMEHEADENDGEA